nr:hypothetical protein [Fibrobacterota bacterium]
MTKGLKGRIIWSTSRDGNHDIYIANIDGSDAKPHTKGQVIFVRSKLDWTIETDANFPERWDTWVVSTDGTGEKLLIPNSTCANWTRDGKSIVFS